MHGNMLEWCQDWYDPHYYRTSSVRDPRGPENGTCRVLRGGAWVDERGEMTCAYRKAAEPYGNRPIYGFRVCIEILGETPETPVALSSLSYLAR